MSSSNPNEIIEISSDSSENVNDTSPYSSSSDEVEIIEFPDKNNDKAAIPTMTEETPLKVENNLEMETIKDEDNQTMQTVIAEESEDTNGDEEEEEDDDDEDDDDDFIIDLFSCGNESDLEKDFKEAKCDVDNLYSTPSCNEFLEKKELIERSCLTLENERIKDEDVMLYPNLNDPEFNLKIALKEEFRNLTYDGDIDPSVKEKSQEMFEQTESFPHQLFVKTFFSPETPYKSLLLYHGTGSGKTCSAIGICEEYRQHVMKTGGPKKPILLVASQILIDNFKKQLFNESKLKEDEKSGLFKIDSCVGSDLLKEVNPMNVPGISREKLVQSIENMINRYYEFIPYIALYNKIEELKKSVLLRESSIKKILRKEFSNRLIVIDEAHNVSMVGSMTQNRLVKETGRRRLNINTAATAIEEIVKYAENVKLLMLTATPMYNSCREIVWLLNIMNKNDRRSIIEEKNVFNKNDELKKDGKEILIRKSTGYISVIRGENPYTFPYRVYPKVFSKQNTFLNSGDENEEGQFQVPTVNMKGELIQTQPTITKLPLYLVNIGTQRNVCTLENPCNNCQNCIYQHIIDNIVTREFRNWTEDIEILSQDSELSMEENIKDPEIMREKRNRGLELQKIQIPLNALVMTFPPPRSQSLYETNIDSLTGRNGLHNIMDKTPNVYEYDYKMNAPRIFKREIIGQYSSKIDTVLNSIFLESNKIAEGIILIYAAHIEGAIIPMALALEQNGFSNKRRNLLRSNQNRNSKLVYTIICGDQNLSTKEEKVEDIGILTDPENLNGDKIKVVIISVTGTEGIDFKYIRQVHILEPWYNMSRNEQIIGRAVRQFGHQSLPLEKRNVQIFMYCVMLIDDKRSQESADAALYSMAAKKAIQIGKVSRILKQNAVDCILNHEQTQLTQENMKHIDVNQILSTGIQIEHFKIGDEDYSSVCDYMNCEYECFVKDEQEMEPNLDTYNLAVIMQDTSKIEDEIKVLMTKQFFYTRENLLKYFEGKFPSIQIFVALNKLIDNQTDYIQDKYGRKGRLVNIDNYYLFQPIELTNQNISLFDRMTPLEYKPKFVLLDRIKTAAKPDVQQQLALQIESAKQQIEADAREVDLRKTLELPKEVEVQENLDVISLLNELKDIYNSVMVTRYKGLGKKNFYTAMIDIKDNAIKKISHDEYSAILVAHFVELLSYKQKTDVMSYLSTRLNISKEEDPSLYFLKMYFESKMIDGIMMLNDGNNIRYIQNWIDKAEPYDIKVFKEKLDDLPRNQFKSGSSFLKTKFGDAIGYYGFGKDPKSEVKLRLKNYEKLGRDVAQGKIKKGEAMEAKRGFGLGVVCPSSSHTSNLVYDGKELHGNTLLQKILDLLEVEKNLLVKLKTSYCEVIEFMLRLYDMRDGVSKRWFFSPEDAMYFELF